MIKLKYIFVFLVLTSTSCFSQITFTNLDSLFTKSFDAVNKRDSVYYLSLVNQTAVFKDKKAKTRSDSAIVLKPFTEAFADLIDELMEMAASPDFVVTYQNYELRNKTMVIPAKGKLPLHVNIVVNDNFVVKMPIVIFKDNDQYFIESPMTVMFAESKE